MELDHLSLVLEVARLGSFAAVARQRNVDPSIISRQVAQMEQQLGFRLFDRTTRRLALTEAGDLALAKLQAPLDEIQQVLQAAHDTAHQTSGRMRVSTSTAFGTLWLIPRLEEFRRRYPRIQLNLLLQDHRIDPIAESVDLTIRMGKEPDQNLPSTHLISTQYRIVASKGYAGKLKDNFKPADIADHPCIAFALPEFNSSWTIRGADGAATRIDFAPDLTISSALGIRQAVLADLGIAMLADWTIDDDLQKGRLVDLLPGHTASATDFESSVWMIRPQRAYLPAKTEALMDYLLEYTGRQT